MRECSPICDVKLTLRGELEQCERSSLCAVRVDVLKDSRSSSILRDHDGVSFIRRAADQAGGITLQLGNRDYLFGLHRTILALNSVLADAHRRRGRRRGSRLGRGLAPATPSRRAGRRVEDNSRTESRYLVSGRQAPRSRSPRRLSSCYGLSSSAPQSLRPSCGRTSPSRSSAGKLVMSPAFRHGDAAVSR